MVEMLAIGAYLRLTIPFVSGELDRPAWLSRRTVGLVTFVTLAVLIVLGALVLTTGFTGPPFDRQGERAIGLVENSLGDRYTLTASRLTSTWTLNRDADVVVRLEGGVVNIDGVRLSPGCYSGEAARGTVVTFDGAENVSFSTPDSDPACAELP